MSGEVLSHSELLDAWPLLSDSDRLEGFLMLSRLEAEELFFTLDSSHQAELLLSLNPAEQRIWMRLLAPDDAADLVQAAPADAHDGLLALLDETTRKEVVALLAYAEDEAGGLMNPRYARLRPDMSVDEAISYLRRQRREHIEHIYYGYVLNGEQRLLGVASIRDLVTALPDKKVRDIMCSDLVSVPEEMDQEAVSHIFAQHDLMALPVVDGDGRMKGIVTADDIVDVVKEEATEDIQKIGGMEALGAPYLQVGMRQMFAKRVVWLAVLFLGQTITATVMGYFDAHISKAVVLALFIPLIISSGGNSGSQAATLVVRAMALGEVRTAEWWRVLRLELIIGLALGVFLGTLGLLRVLVWQQLFGSYGAFFLQIGVTVALSVVGVVLWGTLAGAMLPMLLRRLGFDPASASAPFVATLVDVTGLVIYFSVATMMLSGTLL